MDRIHWNRAYTMEMLKDMPEQKKQQLAKALLFNDQHTSFYGFGYQCVEVYKEGWYIIFNGCHTSFRIWVKDNDGDFEYGHRKPNPSKLHCLYSFNPDLHLYEWDSILDSVTVTDR